VSVVPPEVMREVRASDDEFERSVRAREAARLVESVYAEDAIVLPVDQPMVRGTAQIAEYWQGMFRIGLRDAILETVQVESSGDVACETGRFTLTIEPERADRVQLHGRYLSVHWRRPDGSWRLIANTFCEDAPTLE